MKSFRVKHTLVVPFLIHCIIYTLAGSVQSGATNPDSSSSTSNLSPFVQQSTDNADKRLSDPTTAPLDTTREFTIPYNSHSLKCRDIATNFAYDNNLCDARDPESYFNSKTSYYSCEGRCGDIPVYSNTGTEECSCDEACLVYGDCCRDISIVCPQTYIRASVSYSSYERYNYYCSMNNFLVIYKCHLAGSGEDDKSESENIEVLNPKLSAFVQYEFLLPQPSRTLKQLSGGDGYFGVVDISTGLSFKSLEVLKSCKEPSTIPFFLPVIVSMECFKGKLVSHRTNVATFLNWCRPRNTHTVETPYHRSCGKMKFIKCRCGEKLHLNDNVHNACLGTNKSVPQLSRHQVYKSGRDYKYEIPTRSVCSLTYNRLKPQEYGNKLISISAVLADNPLTSSRKMAAGDNPEFTATSSTFKHGQKEDDKISLDRNDSDDSSVGDSKTGKTNIETIDRLGSKRTFIDPAAANGESNGRAQDGQPENIIHVVEISHTIERRLLCRSLQNHVTECELLDCAHGAILSHGPATGGQFGGSRCLWPTQVVVKNQAPGSGAPICWCIQVVMFLSNLHIWDVNIRVIDNQCVLSLAVKRGDKPELLEAFELGKTVRLSDLRTKWTISFENFTQRFRKLYRDTASLCYRNSPREDFGVCFWFSNTNETGIESKEVSCISIQNGDGFLSRQAGPGCFS